MKKVSGTCNLAKERSLRKTRNWNRWWM